jgi:hypothetical protein
MLLAGRGLKKVREAYYELRELSFENGSLRRMESIQDL